MDPWEQEDHIERRIRDEFSQRVHNFHIQAFDDGLVLAIALIRKHHAQWLRTNSPKPAKKPARKAKPRSA